MAEDNTNSPDSYYLEHSGDNDTIKIGTDDLTKEVRDQTVDHARQIFKDGKNKTQLKLGSKIVSLQTSNGDPAPLSNGDYVEQEYTELLSDNGSEEAVAFFEQTSDSDLLKYKVAKGRVESSKPNVDELYNNVNEKLGDSELAKDVERIQLENNLYSDSEPYVRKDQNVSENNSNVGNARLQTVLGKHGPRKWPNTVASESNVVYEIKKLKNLGVQLLMNSSGEIKAAIPEDPSNSADVLKAQLASTVPGAARLGVKVPTNRFSTAEVAKDYVPNFEKSPNFPGLEQETKYSYGSVNNHLVPFYSISNTSSRAAALLLAATVSGMLKGLAVVLEPPDLGTSTATEKITSFGENLVNSSEDYQTTPKIETRKEYLGSYYPKSEKQNINGLGLGPISTITSLGSRDVIARTKNDYKKAVNTGLKVFFGTPDNAAGTFAGVVGGASGIAGSIIENITDSEKPYAPVNQNPEYFSVLLRFLVRATADDVLGAVGSAASALGADLDGRTPGGLDIDRTPGLDSNPTNLLNVIQELRESKLVKFLNIIAAIGDICIEVQTDDGLFVSKIDSIVDNYKDEKTINPAALISKNRLSDKVGKKFEGRLAWGADTIQSMYMAPNTLFAAEKLWYGNADSKKLLTLASADKNYIKPEQQNISNRLSRDMVRKIESFLDGYYMPFYFHDLRTNEIISFHAFIENVSDSFSADYNETEGYGRVGKVYSYKNTNRNISLSFRIVSTNPDDFDNMWLKINKLVMLLYPQYTKGRQLTFDKGKFIQPFSQIISNSPMVRLRVGDLIKSNYSEFDLARLFGIGTENYDLEDDLIEVDGVSVERSVLEKIRESTNRIVSYDFDIGDKFTLSQFGAAEGKNPAITYASPSGLSGGGLGASTKQGLKSAAGNIVEAAGINTGIDEENRLPPLPINLYVSVQEKIAERVYVLGVNENSVGVQSVKVDFNKTNHALGVTPDYEYIQSKTGTGTVLEDLPVSSIESATAAIGSPNVGGGNSSQITSTNFLGENNPLFRAFESTAGEGLAGFIKNINFDWSDASWATEGLNNRRAPMWCRVDLEFAPVQDISPGLDSSGAGIGLPYNNIGSILKRMKLQRSQTFESDNRADYIEQDSQAAIPNNKKTRK